ncbi:MAG: hypothetical protein ACPGEG_01320 [Salibacteraceae bacterium]
MRLVILSLFIFCLSFCNAQSNKLFPLLVGQTLNGKVVELPDALEGKYSLITMAFSQKSQNELESWLNPVYNKFIAKTGMMDGMYDVNVLFVPMFTGAKKSAMQSVMKSMKAQSDPEIFPHVLFYKGEIGFYEKELGLLDENKPYVFLLDLNGNVVFRTSGRYTEDKMLEIEKILINN